MQKLLFTLGVSLVLAVAHARSAAKDELDEILSKQVNLEHGEELFTACAACHGAHGAGSEDGDIPRIAGQHFTVIARQLADYRHQARWDIRMEHYAGRNLMDDPQALADVAGYVSQLSGEGKRAVGNGELIGRGEVVYAQRCARCHGATGEGKEADAVPRLSGQHYPYLMRQIYDAVDGRRPNFSRAHVRLLAKLERDDIVAVADFLSRAEWRGPVAQVTQVQ